MKLIRRSIKAADPAMSPAQMRILDYLARCPGASLRQLSSELEITNATASSHVDRLVKRSLVKREADPNERRRVVLTMTDEGSQVLNAVRTQCAATFAEMLTNAKGSELGKIRDGLMMLEQTACKFTDQAQSEV